VLGLLAVPPPALSALAPAPAPFHPSERSDASATPVGNFTAAVQRVVTLLGLSGGGLLAIVWARVALSWFSTDVTKKVQAKDRARDALIGSVLFVAALSGLVWGLAHWVVTGT
jgi:hypothetical protein